MELFSSKTSRVIVAFGDSITAMNRWVKPLRARLYQKYGGKYALMNAGISGNCLLYQRPGILGRSFGEKGVNRFDRDMLSFENLSTVILALGVNDVFYYNKRTSGKISLERYIAAVTDIAKRLREQGVRVATQTLTPRKGWVEGGYTLAMEQLRTDINEWLRNCELFDYLFDADAVLRSEVDPSLIDERWHQGDHLHPNAAGGLQMAKAYDVTALTGEA